MGVFYVLFIVALVLLMTRNTRKNYGELKKDARYVETYTDILKNAEDASEKLNVYIEEEQDPELKNKTKIVKIYDDLSKDIDVTVTVEELDINEILLDEDRVNLNNITTNSDMFIWTILVLTKAKNKGKLDVIKNVFDKFKDVDAGLVKNVEYNVFKSTYNCLLDNNSDYSFLKQLLEGNYSNYSYDKQLIGIYKKVAASLLAYKNEELGEEDEILLKEFVLSQVGSRLMSDLGIIDRFKESEMLKEEE